MYFTTAALIAALAVFAGASPIPNDSEPIVYGPRFLKSYTSSATLHKVAIDTDDVEEWINETKAHFSWGRELTRLSAQDGYLIATYPEGSRNPGSKKTGGFGIYMDKAVDAGIYGLSYSVFFPEEFEWVKGGKLPGMYGGHRGCSGGSSASDCFSTRLMWRREGDGELYFYAARGDQSRATCNEALKDSCKTHYGISVDRGSFRFPRGQWTHLQQFVKLNTPGNTDGYFALYVNDKKTIELESLYYRAKPETKVNGLMLDTFFGGSDDSWSPSTEQHAIFSNITFGYDT